MKTISIAMATYNGARFIGEQLESFAAQTILPAELIITDDCSTDNTRDIIASFAAKAPFPVHVEKNSERLGYRANFMKAVEPCRSDLIAFSDQDDVWLPNKLENCISVFKNPDVLLTYHNAIVATDKLENIRLLYCANAPSQALNPPMSLEPWTNGGWGFTTVIDRYLLSFSDLWPKSTDLYDTTEKDKHDQWFLFLASCLGTIAYIDTPLALYRQHGNNTIGWQRATSLQGKLEILLTNEMDGIAAKMISAGSRARILEEMRDELSNPYHSRAASAAAGYRKLEASYRARRDMYASKNLLSRSHRLISLSRFGGYRPRNQWGVGRQALIRDIVRGVFFPSETGKAISFKER